MAEEKKTLEQKQFITKFVNDSGLQTIFVNAVNVRAGLEEFFLTLGTTVPLEIQDIEDLKQIDSIDAQPVFRCAVTRSVMRQMIDVMETVYNQQTLQIDASRQSQKQKGED